MSRHFYEFGPFQFDAEKQWLARAGEPVKLKAKACELLQVLIERRGEVLEKDELLRLLWPDTVVEENNLTVHMTALRKALGDSPNERLYIVTVPGRGYRFVADVRAATEETAELMVEQSKVSVVIEEEITDCGLQIADLKEEASTATKTLPAAISPIRPISPIARLAVAATLLAVLAGIIYWWRTRESAIRNPQSAIHSLAVLPFKSLNPQNNENYLGVGLADVTITRLSSLNQLVVRPTSSVLPFAAQDPLQAGQSLKVDSVLDGSIQMAGNRVRVTVRLLRVADGQPLWAYQCDEFCTDVFTVQDTISRKVTEALALRLTSAEQQRLTRRYTENATAYQAWLKGRYFFTQWNAPSVQKAVESFAQAIQADPDYAPAHADLAAAYTLLESFGGMPSRLAFPLAETAAKRALQLDDTLAEAHYALAVITLFYHRDWARFEQVIGRALALNPNFVEAYNLRSAYLAAVRGRFAEALADRQRMVELDPLTPRNTVAVGWNYAQGRRFGEAEQWFARALELDPNFVEGHINLGEACYEQGRHAQAVAAWLKAAALSGAPAETISALEQAYAAQGVNGYWRKRLAQAEAELKLGKAGPLQLAEIYARLGEQEQALAWLEKAYAEHASDLVFLNVTPAYDSLHADPRFVDLLRRIHLAN